MEYKAAPDGGTPARYLFRTRVLPGCGWKLVTVVRSSLLTQGMNRIGVLLGLVILALLGLFVLFSRYFLNGIVEPVHAVAEGMEQLVNNDLNVQVKPMGQPEDAAEAFFRAEAGQYAVVLFQIDDFAAQASRFGSNLHEKLERPMLELARQIPRLAGRTCIRAVSPERYALRYRVQDASRFETTLPSVVRQVQAVWRDYMNLSVSAAISGLVRENELPAAEETCEKLLRMAPLSGKGAVCTLRREMAAAQAAEQLGKSCDLLIESVCTGNTAQAETEKTEFLHYAAVQPDPNAVLLALLAPATATVVIIKAITIINDMYIPYLYMPKNKLRTLTTFLMDYANAQQGSWQTLAAGIIVIMLPTILVYVFFQRYILAGIAAGAVKE